ncbi:ribonuclease H-like domain-containing protein [Tanacetum coccineum]|uniref:Ribonuclease H-like domain-containing protein n=1 Tax=Tanacetum coccineum TaxID=301880 RepID=A0ABQ4Z9Z3_9ASTR
MSSGPGAQPVDALGASSYLNSSVTSLNTVFNTCIYPSISVGNGHSIPVTNTGHSILPTATKSLHLNNVLITPHIVKNLIYVRQFFRENNCTIEFDAFGFSVKDFLTRRVLLPCDSNGDLYPVTAPSHIPHAFLVSQHTWHQRLGYQGYLADGTLSRYKACLVANGSTQLEGVDVDETFSLVVKPGTIWTVLSLAAYRHWLIHQLDVKNAFLYEDLSETVYMHQPSGFRDSAHPDYVCLLQRSFYGLKQAPRAWFQHFASYITKAGFSHSHCDSSLFIYRQGIDTAYLLLYVDDIVLTASSEGLLQQIIGSLHQEFAVTDLGPLNYFLGISVTCDSSGLFLSQKKYAIEILEKAHMVSCNPSRTPVDIESKLGVDGDPISDLTLYRSLAGSLYYFLHLAHIWLPDADWAGCPTTRRSTSGAEVEYRGVANAVSETCWLRNLLRELHTPLSSATLVYCDNVRVLHIPSRYQFASIFTKGLPSALFEEFRSILSVRSPPALTTGEC